MFAHDVGDTALRQAVSMSFPRAPISAPEGVDARWREFPGTPRPKHYRIARQSPPRPLRSRVDAAEPRRPGGLLGDELALLHPEHSHHPAVAEPLDEASDLRS